MINPDLLVQAEERISRAYASLDTLIMIKNDQRVYSRVFNEACALDKPQAVYSVTKSITAALIGIAVDKGYIGSVSQTLEELLPDIFAYATVADGVKKITLHQVLSMTTGQLWNDGALGSEPMLTRVLQQPDWLAALLCFPVRPSRVGQFQYNTGLSHILSAVISYTTSTRAERFADEHLFGPLGITDYHWPVDGQGHNTGGWGLSLTPQDMAVFGQLMLRRGKYEERQLIPAQWIVTSTTAHTADYGYHWWLKSSQGLTCWCAQGLGGQTVCCIPELDALIVTTSQFAGRRKNLWVMFDEYWLPALM